MAQRSILSMFKKSNDQVGNPVQDKIWLEKPNKGMQCRPGWINCSPVILKIHKGDSLNVSQEYKWTKNVVRFFVYLVSFSLKLNITQVTNETYNKQTCKTKPTTKICNNLTCNNLT